MDPIHLPRARLWATLLALGGNLLVLSTFIAWGWPRYWVNINYERSPLTWFSSVQLLVIALVCAVNAACVRLPVDKLALKTEQQRAWPVLAAAFVFLSVDEQFQIHERLREGVFKPNEIGTELPGIAPGDFLPVLYAFAGIAVATRLWRYLDGDLGARAWLVAALMISAAAVLLDVVGVETIAPDWGRFAQFVEELLETGGQVGFLICFSRHTLRLLSGVTVAAR
jgi:hypothetical protein